MRLQPAARSPRRVRSSWRASERPGAVHADTRIEVTDGGPVKRLGPPASSGQRLMAAHGMYPQMRLATGLPGSPGHLRRPHRYHAGHQQGNQRQRDPDLRPRPVPRCNGRLPQRPGTSRCRLPDLAAIRSVASFFISRVDSEVDTRLDRIATSQATQLKGKAAIANARLAYQAYQEVIASQRWQKLAELGA